MIREEKRNCGTFFFCFCGMILVRTGCKAALAAEMVSFWICINVALFDFFSVGGLPNAEGRDAGGAAAVDAAELDADDDVGAGVGSAVIRSMSVVPDESCINLQSWLGTWSSNFEGNVVWFEKLSRFRGITAIPFVLCVVCCELWSPCSVPSILFSVCDCCFVTVGVANRENRRLPPSFYSFLSLFFQKRKKKEKNSRHPLCISFLFFKYNNDTCTSTFF